MTFEAVKTFIQNIHDTKSIYCHVYNASLPFRRNSDQKWLVSIDEYPYPLYPPYCQGAFYLLHLTVAEKLYELFEEEYHRNYLWIEDVFLGGILPVLGNIQLKDISDYLCHDKVPMYNFNYKHTLAVFTSNLSPNERKEEFLLQFRPFSIFSMATRLKQLFLILLIAIIVVICALKLNVFVRKNWKRQGTKYIYY